MGATIYLATRDIDLGYAVLSAWPDEASALDDLERVYALDLRANKYTERRHYNVESIDLGKAYGTAALEAFLKREGK